MFISPAVAGNHLYIGSCAGTFYALDPATGEPAWSYDTSQDGTVAQFHGDALITEELVVVGTDARPQGFLYAFERADGRARWKIPFPFGVGAQVVRHRDSALAVAMSAEVMGIRLATGEPLWLVEGPVEARGSRTGDPALVGDRLIVGWRPGVVQAFDATTGEIVWQRDLGTALSTSVVHYGGEALVGGFDGTLFRLDPASGKVLGTLEATARGGSPAATLFGDLVDAGECLLALEADGGFDESMAAGGPFRLLCLRPGEPATAWALASDANWSTPRPLVHRGAVVVGIEGEVLAADLETGEVLWRQKTDGRPRGLGADDGTLYVGHYSGTVSALPWEGTGSLSGHEARGGRRLPGGSLHRRNTDHPAANHQGSGLFGQMQE